jgi:hypothetical protein
MQIEILPSDKIDKQKWDECVKQSGNGMIYANSVYLDHLADNWDGVIADDYRFVMPVPWRKKYRIKYCYDVPFIQQLGVFGKNLQEDELIEFKNQLAKFSKYGDYAFNYANAVIPAEPRNNYILTLSARYEVLKQFYSPNHIGNLSKVNEQHFKYSAAEVSETIELFIKLYAKRFTHVSASVYKNFLALCKLKEKENNVILRKVYNDAEVFASVLLLKDERRLYNVMPSTTEKGRQLFAGHYLFDNIVKEFAHTGMILDFEGSDLPGVEKFYKGFGAVNQPYFKMHINRLPLPLRLFKR